MKIISFSPNEDGTKLILEIEDAQLATELYLWNDDTYKDYNKSIDISDKLNGSLTQTIIIDNDDVNNNTLSGVYVVQIEDSDEVISGVTGIYTVFEECILDMVSKLRLCDDCLENISLSLLNAQALLEGLKVAVDRGYIEEARQLRKALVKYCSNDCKTCGKYPNVLDDNYYDYNDK